ncbi:hypothetical protein AQ925_23080 [Burkholderia pseudomallei]|nr:hypothetical protein AQ853_05150 [Burkholderia pseudomallei]OND03084.1 hypothetical protein AQ926_05470 [Burkholderia pseudomallei]OND05816.1 hypothetical protein AQ925_23080 [Burkholderia pseudomallei]OND06918.1 hypothetical protein AQ928_09340 [Burkholderia pseudomallei]OND09580.1 hypothetical protein AQ927_23235 [Burkholderia pseudomallei]
MARGIRIFIFELDTPIFYCRENSWLVVGNNSHTIAISQNISQGGKSIRCSMIYPFALAVSQQTEFDLTLNCCLDTLQNRTF